MEELIIKWPRIDDLKELILSALESEDNRQMWQALYTLLGILFPVEITEEERIKVEAWALKEIERLKKEHGYEPNSNA